MDVINIYYLFCFSWFRDILIRVLDCLIVCNSLISNPVFLYLYDLVFLIVFVYSSFLDPIELS